MAKKKEITYEWERGRRAFHWNENVSYIKFPLCLQCKDHNSQLLKKNNTWVYYSKTDAYELYKFLKKVFKKGD